MIILNINPHAIDSNAIILTVVGYFIVFTALVLLYAVFFYLPKLLQVKISLKRQKSSDKIKEPVTEKEEELTGEVSAAISMALHLFFNQYHDEENTSMTIKRESRLYSPWSSKIYQVRNQFNRL